MKNSTTADSVTEQFTFTSDPNYYYNPYYYNPCNYGYPIYIDKLQEWLKGFLEGKEELSKEEVKIIKKKINMR